ncbi:MAG: hypothetical protein EOO15_01445 [Chitinophagaceae bacterium]|nr:MAG: hypothetical protein EOO15_01445 [Chitinophagaceae bacterium]
MNNATLSPGRRWLAVQRITALWAFCESGLGGVLHALRLPFTGLVVGSFSVLCITLIAWLSEGSYRRVLHSLLLALIIKAAVSPHSPPTAYFAVAFQGVAGYLIYSAFSVRSASIYAFAVIALLESAFQKLLTLTLFFGKSFWRAVDELVGYVGKELSVALPLGSVLLVSVYVGIYLAGGILCGTLARILVQDFRSDGLGLPPIPDLGGNAQLRSPARRRRSWMAVALFMVIGIILYIASDSKRQGSLAVLQAFTWTASALLLWYGLIAPMAMRLLHRYLLRRRSQHSGEVQELLRLLPALRRIAVAAWRASAVHPGRSRFAFFVRLLVHWSLTCESVELQPEAG